MHAKSVRDSRHLPEVGRDIWRHRERLLQYAIANHCGGGMVDNAGCDNELDNQNFALCGVRSINILAEEGLMETLPLTPLPPARAAWERISTCECFLHSIISPLSRSILLTAC